MNQTSIPVPLDGSTMAQSALSVAEHYAGGLDDVEMITRYGPAAGVILDTARTHDHDLIVMATRGRACMNSALYRSWWSE